MAVVGMKRFRTEEGSGEVGSPDVAANVLVLISRGAGGEGPRHPGRLFRCKSCARQFPSFQALGGHRASHKKPRLGDGNVQAQHAAAPAKPRAHECPICGLEFTMGQALGGHMRRHRAAAGAFPLVFVEKKHGVGGGGGEKRGVVSLDLDLDLNLSLPSSDEDDDLCALKLGLGLPWWGVCIDHTIAFCSLKHHV